MALTDGEFSTQEWKMLHSLALERGISANELEEILVNTTGAIPIPEKLEDRLEYLFDLAKMIWADGKVVPDEVETLQKYCKKFMFKDENIAELAEYLLKSAKSGMSTQELLNELR